MADASAQARLAAQLLEIVERNALSYTERFEQDAEQFYRETGFLAPGKSVPLAMAYSESEQERRGEAWTTWTAGLRAEFDRTLRDAAAALAGPNDDVVERLTRSEVAGGHYAVTKQQTPLAALAHPQEPEQGQRLMSDEVPRRNRMDQWVPAERAIYDALLAVEAMPADLRLTDAVVQLGAAKDSVADFVDNVPRRAALAGPPQDHSTDDQHPENMPREAWYKPLHELWTWAVGKEGYDKEKWMRLEGVVSSLFMSRRKVKPAVVAPSPQWPNIAKLSALLLSFDDWLGNSEGLMIEDVVDWREQLADALGVPRRGVLPDPPTETP